MIRRLWIAFLVLLALAVLGGLAVEPQPHFAVERLFAFNALYGFLACAALILIAKTLGLLLKRGDGYYDE